MTAPSNRQVLAGFNVGLSGAIPERDEWTEPALDRAILEFVSTFSAIVFKYGGCIVHGSHPAFTPILLRQAGRHAKTREEKAVTLFVSELWAKSLDKDEMTRYQTVADVVVTRQVGQGGPDNVDTRNKSLTMLRGHLTQRMNLLVAIGGKLHQQDGNVPGVLEELKLARDRGMPCFLVGGMGGMTKHLAKNYPLVSMLENGLDQHRNESLQTTTDVASCVSIIVDHLIQHPELAQRALKGIDVNEEDCLRYERFIQQGGTAYATKC